MSDPISPFLHQDRPKVQHERVLLAPTHSGPHVYVSPVDKLAAEKRRGLFTLERLRYRWYVRRGSLSNFMQRLGDVGRDLFHGLARRWW